MNKWTKTARWICIACMLGASGNLFAQEDHLIENQRDVLIIDDTAWGDTYLGKYTTGNELNVANGATLTSKGNAYVGLLPSASNNTALVSSGSKWVIDDVLQIGATNNAGNTVTVQEGGTIKIEALSILGSANGNTFTLGTNGTLHVTSDFNASMDGFIYEADNTLKVGGELSGLDNVEERRTVSLIGPNATWSLGGDLLTIGGLSDSNHVSFESGATVSVSNATLGAGGDFNAMTLEGDGTEFTVNNLTIGSLATMTNELVISSGARTHILDSLTIQGAGNALQVTNGGWLEVEMDFDATMAGFDLQNGGGLEAHRNLTMDAITNGVHVVLDGENALWDRDVQDLDIGSTFTNGGNSLVVENGAQAHGSQLNLGSLSSGNNLLVTTDGEVRVGAINVGSGNIVAMEYGGNLIIEGGGSILGGNLSVTTGGKLTFESDFDLNGARLGDNFYWQDGGILEVQGAAPIFNDMTVYGKYIEYGTLFLQRGQILVLNGSNAKWNASPHNLHIGDLSSGNALIVTNGGYAEVKSMTLGDFKEGGHDNSVLITGAGSEIHSLGDVEVGGRFLAGEWIDGGSNNTLRIEDGGTLNSDGAFRFGGNNNTFSIGGASSQFSIAGDMLFGGSSQLIQISNGATLTNNTFSMAGDGNTLLVDGAGSVLAATGDMTFDGSGLLIGVTDGGILTGGGAFTINGTGSSVLVDGVGSRLAVSGDIVLDGPDIVLSVFNGGKLSGGATLRNQNSSSGLQIGLGSTMMASNYYQTAGAFLNYEINQTPTNLGILQITNTANFEAGAKLGFYGVSNLAMDVTYSNMLVSSETLIIDGNTNATTANLSLLDTSESSLVKFLLVVQDDDILAILNRITLAESAGFTEGSMMWDIANEIDRLSLNGSSEKAEKQIEILNGMSGSKQNLQLNQLYAYELPTYMHNQGVFGGIDQVRARGLSAHEPARSKPKGAAGPHAEDQGLQGWAKIYGSFGNRDSDDSSGFEDGYDAQTYGTVIGLDQAFGDWLFGIAGGYAVSTLDGDNGDESDATTGYGILYANYGAKDWFGDLILSYGLTDMDNTSGTDFDVKSSTDASQTTFYIGGGYQLVDEPSGALLRPLLGLQVSQFDQDAYTEKSSNALAKDVDTYDHWSYQSTLGASMIFPKTGKKVDMELQLRAYWLHEFNDDEEKVGYTLIDSGLPGQFLLRSPDSDVAQLGTGFVVNWKAGWQLRADIDLQLSKTFTSTTLSGALLYEF